MVKVREHHPQDDADQLISNAGLTSLFNAIQWLKAQPHLLQACEFTSHALTKNLIPKASGVRHWLSSNWPRNGRNSR